MLTIRGDYERLIRNNIYDYDTYNSIYNDINVCVSYIDVNIG